jgi:four helix bundle protein
MPIQSYKELIVWQKSMELVSLVYGLTALLPRSEQFGLISQMQRAAVSIPSNIAEGRQRGTRKDFVQFLRIASGSLSELETQALIVHRQFGKDISHIESLILEVGRMLTSMMKKLE